MTVSTNKCMPRNYWRIIIFSICAVFISAATAAGFLNTIHNPNLPPPSMSNSFHGTLTENSVGIPCFIEYQVTKQKVGQCVKLGDGVRGCLADTYINPFHPDCL